MYDLTVRNLGKIWLQSFAKLGGGWRTHFHCSSLVWLASACCQLLKASVSPQCQFSMSCLKNSVSTSLRIINGEGEEEGSGKYGGREKGRAEGGR